MPVEVSRRERRPRAVSMAAHATSSVRDAGGQLEHRLLGRTRPAARRRAGRRASPGSGRTCRSPRAARWRPSARPRPRRPARASARRSRAWRRRRCRGWARPCSTTAGLGGQPAGEHDLLLVAAGEELHLLVHRPGRDRERGEQAGHLAAGGAGAAREDRADHAERVVEDGLVEREAGGLAVLGDQGQPGPDRRRAGSAGARPAVDAASRRG